MQGAESKRPIPARKLYFDAVIASVALREDQWDQLDLQSELAPLISQTRLPGLKFVNHQLQRPLDVSNWRITLP